MSATDSIRSLAGFGGRLVVAALLGFACGSLVVIVSGVLFYAIVASFGVDLPALLATRAQEVTLVYGAIVGLLIAELVTRFDQYLLGERQRSASWWLIGLIGGAGLGYLTGSDINAALTLGGRASGDVSDFDRLMAVTTSLGVVASIIGPLLGILHGLRWQAAVTRPDEDQARSDEFAAFLQRRREE